MPTPDPLKSVAGSPARNRRLVSALACAFLTLASAVAWPAAPAQAHDELTSSTPPAGARLVGAPRQVRLVFSDKVEPGFTTVALKVADRPVMTLAAQEDGLLVTADVPASAERAPAAGGPVGWHVYYRIVSADGHPVSGSVSFTVASTGGPSASVPSGTPVPSGSATTRQPAASQSILAVGGAKPSAGGRRPVPLMLLVGGGLVVGLGAAVWLTRAKPGRS